MEHDRLCGTPQAIIAEEELLLRVIDDPAGNARPDAEPWSKKEELGHLVDSSTNNRARFVNPALAGRFEGPSYDGRGWVDLGAYAEMRWTALVDLWKTLNTALATLIARVPKERRSAECRIGGSSPARLEFVIRDYIEHMQHQLDHILSRDQVRSYSSAEK